MGEDRKGQDKFNGRDRKGQDRTKRNTRNNLREENSAEQEEWTGQVGQEKK